VIGLGLAQTLAWGSTYYLPAILANSIAAEFGRFGARKASEPRAPRRA
jgi:hypothetical protein